jgi:signal recognition particle subunit SRP54
MTSKERRFPDILVAGATAQSRRNRIVKGAGRSDKDLAQLIILFGSMRVKMQKMSVEISGASTDVGLTPQLSEEDMNALANEGLRKSVSPGMVRRQKIRRLAALQMNTVD